MTERPVSHRLAHIILRFTDKSLPTTSVVPLRGRKLSALGILESRRFDMAAVIEQEFKITLDGEAVAYWETFNDVVRDVENMMVPREIEPMKQAINKLTREDVRLFAECNKHDTNSVGYNAIDHYATIATKSAIYPGVGTPLGLAYVALKLNGEAGEFAEHVGKAMRDDDLIPLTHEGENAYSVEFYELTPERRELIIKEIGDVLWYLSAACNELGISLSEAALKNLEKLADRTERDALRGSGDER